MSVVAKSNLANHAIDELQRAGLYDADSDYGGMIGQAVQALVELFASQGHSGMSAHIVLDVFNRVARFKTLTPITSDPSEWMDVADMMPNGDPPLWQNKRQSSCFSNDGGRTYYDIDAGDNRAIRTSEAPKAS